MPKPTTNYLWATEDLAEYYTDDDDQIRLTLNKLTPSLDMISSGFRVRSPISRGAYNYQLNSCGLHLEYLYTGEVGDIKYFADSAGITSEIVRDRFGGVWADRGVTTQNGLAVRIFEKTL